MVGPRIQQLVACVMLLLWNASALRAETQLPFDSRPLVEVRTLDAIPKEVITLLGWHLGGPDGITDRFHEFNATESPGSNLPHRLFELAGVSSAAAVVIYEQAGRPPTYHAVAFMMTRTGWSHVREWALDEDPRTLLFFLYTVDSVHYPLAELHLRQNRRYRVETRIIQTRPARRDGPLRKANLSDDEAREIQSVMSPIYPGAILNISGVVTGCPCEEGPGCSDQVWVVPENDLRNDGVSLSLISGRWTVGPIQKWWFDKAQLEADPHLTPHQRREALDSQWEAFPGCARATTTVGQ
jgi:hypothetical protein